MSTSAIIMLLIVSGIFGTGITTCVIIALRRAKAESYGEGEDGPS